MRLKYFLVDILRRTGLYNKSVDDIDNEAWFDYGREFDRSAYHTSRAEYLAAHPGYSVELLDSRHSPIPPYRESRLELPDGSVVFCDVREAEAYAEYLGAQMDNKEMTPFEKVVDNITYDSTTQMVFLLSVVGVFILGGVVIYYCYRKKNGKPKPSEGSESKPSEGSESKPSEGEGSESKPSEGSEKEHSGGLDDSVKISDGSMLEENNTTLINLFDRFWDPFL